jgi:CheY-like chemotaxis protein
MPSFLNVVAIIDDDNISLLLVKKILEQKRMAETVLLFSSGFDALHYFEKNTHHVEQLPSVLLLDIKMPLMNGFQFLKEFQQIEFAEGYEPAIFIVSAGVNIDYEALKEYPFVKGFLLKPVIPEKLAAMIEQLKLNNAKTVPLKQII